jgi:hypothetical protein
VIVLDEGEEWGKDIGGRKEGRREFGLGLMGGWIELDGGIGGIVEGWGCDGPFFAIVGVDSEGDLD